MTVTAIGNYQSHIADRLENFHGNQLVYISWDKHLMVCSPMAFPLPPSMPFGAIIDNIMPEIYDQHPEFEKINWSSVQWSLNGETFTPDLEKSLEANGVDHKSVIRFVTPELKGIGGSGS